MTAVTAPTTSGRTAPRRALDVVAIAVVAYVPFLLSSPGTLSADSKGGLYLDPGRLLARAPYLWDRSAGFGTVSHQTIGYLFPVGPYYWLMDALGVPTWVAQRLFWGTLLFAAGAGARWLFLALGTRRLGALAGAAVYMLAPYLLSFLAGLSVLLLPWAALPWLVGFAARAQRDGGWRDPACFALVLLFVGSINASSLVFVLLAPALWLLVEAFRGAAAMRRAFGATARIALLSIGVSVWWVVGLRTQGAYGLPILQLTETLRTVAEWSNPTDLFRGLGNWLLTSEGRLGFVVQQGPQYFRDDVVVAAAFAIPVLALVAAGAVRWRHRTYFSLLLVVGVVVGVGAWPYDDPSPYGSVFEHLASRVAAVFALRNTPRAAPLVLLAVAALLAAGVSALGDMRRQIAGASVVVAVVAVALLPVWQAGWLAGSLDRPGAIPQYWSDASRAVDRDGDATRALELPGQPFFAYRWGNAVDPVVPSLVDRPYVTRVVLPTGTAPSVDMIDALDQRLQEGTLEPAALAAWARLAGVGTVVLRSDTEYERYDSPRPRIVWQQLTDPLAPGLDPPITFGSSAPNVATSDLPMLDPLELRIPTDAANPPKVALFEVHNPVPIVHTAAAEKPVVLSGDAQGIVDAAAAGLLDGNQLVFESAPLTKAELLRAMRSDADVVITDTNRKRSHNFFAGVRETDGYTQRAGQKRDRRDDSFFLDPFGSANDDARTVVEQRGARVDATDYVFAADRPANAFDGDARTAWRVGKGAVGDELVIRPDTPVHTDHMTLTQLPFELRSRRITDVRLHFDGGDTMDVPLTDASQATAGQTVQFPMRDISELVVEIRGVHIPDHEILPPVVGLTEVGLGDVHVHEVVRLPVDVAQATGAATQGNRLDVVLSRLRYEPAQLQDQELAMDREVVLPTSRSFGLTGTARVDPNAADSVLDLVLGTQATGTTFTSSDHLVGDADARASRAFDGDATTAWTPNFGRQSGRWIDVALPSARSVDHVDLTIVTDGRHALPTQFTLTADGTPVRTFTVDPRDDGVPRSGTSTVHVPFDPVSGRDFRLVVDAVIPQTTRIVRGHPKVQVPVSIAEVGLGDVPRPALSTTIDSGCRADLVQIDDAAVPVRISGPAAAARSGLSLAPCGAAVTLPSGANSIVTSKGLDTGLDLDRIVLTSAAGGAATGITTVGAPLETSGAKVRVTDRSPDSYEVKVRSDGQPFWLVLGESHNTGWEASTEGARVGDLQLVNGYANAWLVTPRQAGTFTIGLQWTPQRAVWLGLAVSAVAVLACVAIVVVAVVRRRRGARGLPADADLRAPPAPTSAFRYEGSAPRVLVAAGVALGVAVVVTAFSRPWIGVTAGVAAMLAASLPHERILLTAGAPGALVLARVLGVDELAWLALGLVLADVFVSWARSRSVSRQQAVNER